MPLPKPPATKAALLTPVDFEAQAAPRTDKKSLKTTAVAEPATGSLNLHDASATAAAPVKSPSAKPGSNAMPVKAPSLAAAPKPRVRKPRGDGPPKLFVLDTNVLMHDPMSLFRFEEHDVFLPMITLEELDGHKKGMSEVARNARQVSRELDALATDSTLVAASGARLQ